MTYEEIQAELDAIVPLLAAKGIIEPAARLYCMSEEPPLLALMCEYQIEKSFHGALMEQFDAARAYIATLPSPEDVVTNEYLRRVASAVDYATENSIEDEYVTPLRDVTCAMTDNLLTKENP